MWLQLVSEIRGLWQLGLVGPDVDTCLPLMAVIILAVWRPGHTGASLWHPFIVESSSTESGSVGETSYTKLCDKPGTSCHLYY